MTTSEPATILPPDGNWTSMPSVVEAASQLGPQEVVLPALHVLASIFTPEWAKRTREEELAQSGSPLHPLLRYLAFPLPGNIRPLIELGLALAFTKSPAELTHDLTTPARYRSRCREIITAAYFRYLGAKTDFIPEGPGDKRSEFTASFDDQKLAVEVKGLDHGPRELLHVDAVARLSGRIPDTKTSLPPTASSSLVCQLGARVFDDLIHGDQIDPEVVERFAAELGVAWARVVEEQPPPESHPGPRGTTLLVQPTAPASGHHLDFADALPEADNYLGLGRLRQRLTDAAKKFEAFGLPGIVVLEPPGLRVQWPAEFLRRLDRRLRGAPPWTEHIAALILAETWSFAPGQESFEHGSNLRVLQGRRWSELPPSLQDHWRTCTQCGYGHDHFDLVSLVKNAAATSSNEPSTPSEHTGP